MTIEVHFSYLGKREWALLADKANAERLGRIAMSYPIDPMDDKQVASAVGLLDYLNKEGYSFEKAMPILPGSLEVGQTLAMPRQTAMRQE